MHRTPIPLVCYSLPPYQLFGSVLVAELDWEYFAFVVALLLSFRVIVHFIALLIVVKLVVVAVVVNREWENCSCGLSV